MIRKFKFFLCLLYMLLMPGVLFAQDVAGKFRDKTDKDIVGARIVETDPSETYVRERETILRQLEIITGDEETRYIIVSGDTLNINFRDGGSINEGVYQVSSSGEIHLPLVGALKVSGQNRQRTRQRVNYALEEYIRYPKAEVLVNISGRYMVAGEVLSPGVFRIRSNLTLMEAVLGATYDKDSAKLNSIVLIRGNYDKPIVTRLNLRKMIRQGDRTDNILIKPGDFIFVPKTFIVNIEKFVKTIHRYVSAYYGLGRIPGEPSDGVDQVFFE